MAFPKTCLKAFCPGKGSGSISLHRSRRTTSSYKQNDTLLALPAQLIVPTHTSYIHHVDMLASAYRVGPSTSQFTA